MYRLLKKFIKRFRLPKTRLPKHIRVKKRSIHGYEKNAAHKVALFAKRHSLEPFEMQEIFDAEVVYEKAKYTIRKDYPEDVVLRKKLIGEEKKRKYANLKEKVDYEMYSTYRSHRQNRKRSTR